MKVKRLAEQVVREHGCNHPVRVEERTATGESFEAFTTLENHETTLRYDPAFTLPTSAGHFARRTNLGNPLAHCVHGIMGHECGHIHNKKRKACPGTLEDHIEHFYEPIAEVLKAQGKLGALDSVVNMAEDLVDNTLLAQGAHSGLSLFYEDVAQKTGWSAAYQAYMRMQLTCWGDAPDKQMLAKHYTHNPEIITATQQFLGQMKLDGRRRTKPEMAAYVADKANWKTLAKKFAEAIAPLIEPSLSMPMCGYGKAMQKTMQDSVVRGKIARKRYDDGSLIPAWMGQQEGLDAVYASLAREISVKVEAPRKAMSMPIVPYQHAPFDPEQDSPNRINFRKPMVIPEQETPFGIEGLSFGVPQRFIERPLLVKKSITHFPEFKCAYIDASGSMTEGIPDELDTGSSTFIPWGDKSKYHYLCKAWYGIVEYLARQQILPNVEVGLGAFAASSHVSHGLSDAKKLLLNPAFGGNTLLDETALENLLHGNKSVFFTVSDGEVSNWSGVKDHFIARAKQHYYFHIQIGVDTQMTNDLRAAELPVYPVHTGKELEQMAIDLVKGSYQSYVQKTLRLFK